MFHFFERIVAPTAVGVEAPPPAGLLRFYWHFLSQAKGLFAALFCAGLVVSLLDSTIPWFIGRLVRMITNTPPATFMAEHGAFLAAMAFVVVVCRPLAIALQGLISNSGIAANVTNLVRWQSHRHVVR